MKNFRRFCKAIKHYFRTLHSVGNTAAGLDSDSAPSRVQRGACLKVKVSAIVAAGGTSFACMQDHVACTTVGTYNKK
jgi:hypothetical protein